MRYRGFDQNWSNPEGGANRRERKGLTLRSDGWKLSLPRQVFPFLGPQSATGLLFGVVALFLYIVPPLSMLTAPAVAFRIWTIAACTFAIVSMSASVSDWSLTRAAIT